MPSNIIAAIFATKIKRFSAFLRNKLFKLTDLSNFTNINGFMNILVIGSGAREHAIIWALKKSHNVGQIFAAPGNAGINSIATHALIAIDDPINVIEFCRKNSIELVVVGPEAPLVAGLSDALDGAGIMVFGPSKKAAQLEGSKNFTKELCKKYNIPTAAYESFNDANKAKEYIKLQKKPIVIKADGLAAGKGVIIAHDSDEANNAIDSILVSKKFGVAGNLLVIEEFLEGEELSFFALSDGKNALFFGSAQDHKKVGDGDTGPNTGGMGAYSPAPILSEGLQEQIMSQIIRPTVSAMAQEGTPFKGVLFAGLMITKDGPKLIEYNVRFGDPETQVLMARLDSDLLPLLIATAKGNLNDITIKHKNNAALCVVMAAKGYPDDYEKGSIINNLEEAAKDDHVEIFHAGTKITTDGAIVANGGRVLGVTAICDDVASAQRLAYKAIDKINWPSGFCRRDIGFRAVKK